MSALTVAAVRQRVEAALVAASGYTKSRYHPDLFGFDTRFLMHGAFVVGAPATELHPTTQRQKVAEGALINTTLEVKVAANMRADAQISDFDALLALEAGAITTVEAVSRTNLHILYQGAARETTTQFEFQISTITFRAIHRLALQ